jgi:hypothetical protein
MTDKMILNIALIAVHETLVPDIPQVKTLILQAYQAESVVFVQCEGHYLEVFLYPGNIKEFGFCLDVDISRRLSRIN